MIILLDFIFTAIGFKKHFFFFFPSVHSGNSAILWDYFFSYFIYVLICVYQKPLIWHYSYQHKGKKCKENWCDKVLFYSFFFSPCLKHNLYVPLFSFFSYFFLNVKEQHVFNSREKEDLPLSNFVYLYNFVILL